MVGRGGGIGGVGGIGGGAAAVRHAVVTRSAALRLAARRVAPFFAVRWWPRATPPPPPLRRRRLPPPPPPPPPPRRRPTLWRRPPPHPRQQAAAPRRRWSRGARQLRHHRPDRGADRAGGPRRGRRAPGSGAPGAWGGARRCDDAAAAARGGDPACGRGADAAPGRLRLLTLSSTRARPDWRGGAACLRLSLAGLRLFDRDVVLLAALLAPTALGHISRSAACPRVHARGSARPRRRAAAAPVRGAAG